MKKHSLAATVVGAAVAAISPLVNATTFVSAGANSCQPQTTDAINHTVSGVSNPSTSAASVFVCPLNYGTQTASQTLSAVVIRYVDNSSTDTFSCVVYETTYGGSVYTSSSKYTCSTAGGCTDSTTSFTGSNYLQWNYSELGSTLGVQFLDGNYGVLCAVPKIPSGGVESRLVSYYSYY